MESSPDITGVQLKGIIADMFPPDLLFREEICDLPAVHIELRNFLDERGANLRQHSSHRVVMKLAHGLYEEAEDTQAAIEMAREIVAAGLRPRSTTSGSSSSQMTKATSTNIAFPEKTAHNVAMRLREKDKTFSSDLGESWMEYVDEYLQLSRDYSLTPSLKSVNICTTYSKETPKGTISIKLTDTLPVFSRPSR